MYDNVVNDLRHCVESPNRRGCAEACTIGKEHPLNYLCIPALMTQAADAIEELTALSLSQERQLVELTEQASRAPHWTSVEEQPPKLGEAVLAFDPGEQDYMLAYLVFDDGDDELGPAYWWVDDVDSWLPVESYPYWMPLPAPPKEVDA